MDKLSKEETKFLTVNHPEAKYIILHDYNKLSNFMITDKQEYRYVIKTLYSCIWILKMLPNPLNKINAMTKLVFGRKQGKLINDLIKAKYLRIENNILHANDSFIKFIKGRIRDVTDYIKRETKNKNP